MSEWRRFCHQVGQSIPNTLKPCEVNVGDIIQKWITRIEITEHKSSCKSFCTMLIKVTANMLQIQHMVKAPISLSCWKPDSGIGNDGIRILCFFINQWPGSMWENELLARRHHVCGTVCLLRCGPWLLCLLLMQLWNLTSSKSTLAADKETPLHFLDCFMCVQNCIIMIS